MRHQEEGPEANADVSTFIYKNSHCRHGKHADARKREERLEELLKQQVGDGFPGGSACALTQKDVRNIFPGFYKSSRGTFYPFVKTVSPAASTALAFC